MKKKLALALAAALVLSMALTSCGNESSSAGSGGSESGLSPKEGGTSLTFTTGGETGTYYGFGSVIAGKVTDMTSTTNSFRDGRVRKKR